jgi:hypothetical protein
MATTQNFGLNKFGVEGRISDNNYKFSDKDRDLLDALLYTLYQHDHRPVSQGVTLASPSLAPVLTVSTTGGTIAAATTVFYRIAFVDSSGNETASSVSAFATTDEPLANPPTVVLSTATTGGTLEPGTYRYALSFYQSAGGETRAPNPQTIVVPAGTTTNTITIDPLPTLPSGADGWKIYRKGVGDDEFNLLATVAAGATPPTSYTDDGSVLADCTKHRPTSNTTNGANKVTVAIDPTDLPLDSRVASWRIYKSTTGVYGANSLLATVTDTVTAGGSDLVTSYSDTGQALSRGTPLGQTAVPPLLPQLDAGDVFSASSDPLPSLLAPKGVHAFNIFMPGTLTNAKTFSQTVLPWNIDIERVDAFFIDAPNSQDTSNYVTIRIRDDSLVDEVQCVYNDAITVNEIQKVSTDATGGTFTLTFDDGEATPPSTNAIAYNATAATVETELEALSNIADVTVTGTGTSSDPWVITFVDPGARNINQLTGDGTGLTGGTLTITTTTQGNNGGTFTLDYDGQVTGAINYNAPGAALATPDGTSVEEKLQALSNITDVSVTGTGTEADPWCVTFVNPGDQDVVEMLADDTNLNGSTTITTTTEGRGNQILDVVIQNTTNQLNSWVSSTTDAGEQEAEAAPATGGAEVSDQFATNDLVMELDTQNETNSWTVGTLDAGDYIARFWVALETDATATLSVINDIATPVTLASRNLNAARAVYEPAFQVKFTADGSETIKFQVEKTDATADTVRVDKYDYLVDLPTMYAGQTMTIESLITGTPTDAGGDVNLTIWY